MDRLHPSQVAWQEMHVQSGPVVTGSQNLPAIGKYQLVASLAQGGMAKVYLALVAGPADVNKLMVLKVLTSEMLQGPEGSLDLFWDEARLAARLVHPNIVHTYEVGEADGNYFLAMEYLDGQTLRVLQSRPPEERLPRVEELRILSEVARGLQYAHDLEDFHGAPLNVVHRDVSPQNVFVTYDGQVKLIDFGIAKMGDAKHHTRAGLIKGKLNYMAPEQLRGASLDRRADVFALGVMLWETVAGRRFAGEAHVAEVTKIHARLKGEEPNIRSVQPDVPEALASIIDRALQLDCARRWHDAAAFADALDAYLESTGQRPGARSLAAWMQQGFAQERAAMHRTIDERVQRILQTPSAAENGVPAFPLHDGTSSASWTGRERSGIQGSSAQHVSEQADSIPPRAGQSARLTAIGTTTVLAAVALAALLIPTDAAAPLGPVASPVERAAVASAPSPTPGAAQASSASAAAPAQVHIRVTALPPGAQVSIDGAPITLPFSGDFVKSSVLHRIEATAKKYKPSARLVSFAQDQTVAFELTPIVEASEGRAAARPRVNTDAHGAAAPAAAPSQQPRPAPSEEPAKAQGSVPVAELDTAKSRNDAVLGGVDGGTGHPHVNTPLQTPTPPKDLPGNRFPAYPNSAHRHGLVGTVVVAFDVLPDGKVTNPKIVDGPEEFHETVLKTALTWRFRPAMLGGKPVGHRHTKTIKFNLEDD